MSYKSRENFAVNACICACKNRDKKCSDCVNKSEFLKNKPSLKKHK